MRRRGRGRAGRGAAPRYSGSRSAGRPLTRAPRVPRNASTRTRVGAARRPGVTGASRSPSRHGSRAGRRPRPSRPVRPGLTLFHSRRAAAAGGAGTGRAGVEAAGGTEGSSTCSMEGRGAGARRGAGGGEGRAGAAGCRGERRARAAQGRGRRRRQTTCPLHTLPSGSEARLPGAGPPGLQRPAPHPPPQGRHPFTTTVFTERA